MTATALFDLEQPLLRPVWGTTACHTCHEPLKRFVRQEPDTGWYRWELDHTAWDHLRAHEQGRLLLRVMPFSVGSTNGAQILRGAA